MFYVYLLENIEDKTWYTGFSSNLKQRIKDHYSGKGGRHTRLKPNWKLIYYEAYLDRTDALGREKFLKSGSGKSFLKKQLRNYLNS
jgi:putative endonuclease